MMERAYHLLDDLDPDNAEVLPPVIHYPLVLHLNINLA